MSDTCFCQDRDLLCIEPVIFIGGGFASQQLIGGIGASIAEGKLHWQEGDFASAGVKPGMAVNIWQTSPCEGNAYEILSVDSASELTIPVLRAGSSGPAVAPADCEGASFHVRTFEPQIQAASAVLAEKLRLLGEATGVAAAGFADSAQLRTAAAYGALERIFTARSENASSGEANWIKAQHYREIFRQQQVQLRLAVDVDGDGVAEQTRTLGNVQLRRA